MDSSEPAEPGSLPPSGRYTLLMNRLSATAMTAFVSFLFLLGLFMEGAFRTRSVTFIAALVFLAITLRLIKAGRVQMAAGVQITSLWLALSISNALNGGVNAPGFPIHIPLVMLAGLLLGMRAAVTTAVMSTLAGAAMVIGEARGEPSDVARLMVFAAIMALVIVLNHIAIRSIRRILNRATHEHEQLCKAEADMAATEKSYRDILDELSEAVFIHDPQTGAILDVNASAERMFGYTRPELQKLTVADISRGTPPYASADALAHIRAADEKGPVIFEWVCRRKSGECFPVEVSLRKGSISGADRVIATVRDISERKIIQAAADDARTKAEQANRAKSEFLANMSHEVRTPMNAILGFTALLLEDPKIEGENRQYLELVRSRGRDLLSIMNDLLDLSRIEAGRMTLIHTVFSLRSLLTEAIEVVSLDAATKRLALEQTIAPGVADMRIGDALRLKQVLINLLGNAVKFTEHGHIHVHVQRAQADGLLQFTVEDTGAGIAPDKHEFIFQQFTQADGSTTRRHGGAGLGLAIAQRLVVLMQGRIWVESSEGSGSRFHFTARLDVAQH